MTGLALLSLSLGVILWQPTLASQDSCPVCEDVHFFLARGNNEPYPGRQGTLVAATCDGLSSCGYEDLIYSALYTDEYCQTAYDGSIAGLVQIPKYAQQCPDSKLILAGYSQGGQIAGDILGGGGGTSFNGCLQPDTPALDSSTGDKSELAVQLRAC
ncbi:carbohydrate esterase family 5 protein [Teratosphaeria destructans]|uniref:Carbohydrate esterase family 5 protein n=1 Tax=Teratosphaeria destructans TaxID=418781 RepID=A0A9W7VXP2_9PEZI|nr:carbohydrate esterase family 5 protein [Teratosphaeria destructans]